MKLAFVEIEGFRGFKERTRFEIPEGFAVITGRNGVGKSTLFDALDFVLTGTINKYDVKGAKGGGLDSHIWWVGEGFAENYAVTIGFRKSDGEFVTATRSRDRGVIADAELGEQLCLGAPQSERWAETLMQTSLIRDETLASLSVDLPQQARFDAVRAAIGALSGPDHSRRLEAILGAAADLKTRQEEVVRDLQTELSRQLGELTVARSEAERQTNVADAHAIIRRVLPDADDATREPDQLLGAIVERKRAGAELVQALARSRRYLVRLAELDPEKVAARKAAIDAEISARQDLVDAQATDIKTRTSLVAAEAALDVFASNYAALLDHGRAVGLVDHHCPLCDAVRTHEEFQTALAAAQARLSERGERVQAERNALSLAQEKLSQIQAELEQFHRERRDLDERLAAAEAEAKGIESAYARFGIVAPADKPEVAEREIARLQEETTQLEQALYILESSSAHDRVASLQRRESELRLMLDDERAKLAAAEKAHEAARQMKNAAVTVANELLTEQFDTVMPLLKELYRRLRPHTAWREIETDFGGKIRATLNFTVGDGRNPQFLFSSGQRRAAGLAFLLAIHLSRPWCALRSLWLDDPVQHVDDYRALNLVEVLSAIRRSGRQVIVAVEDAALADLLCRRLRSSVEEPGRRFELATDSGGSGVISKQIEILPMPDGVLEFAEAS